MHSRTDKIGARPKGDAPSQTQVVFLSTPCDPRYRLFSTRAKNSKRNESNQRKGVGTPSDFPAEAGIRGVGRCGTRSEARDGGRPTPSSFLRRQESRAAGKGHTLTPTPFLEDTVRATLPPCTAAQTKMGARPQRRSAHTTPGCFPIYTLQLQIGLFPPGAKNSKRNESNQRRGWHWGAPPSHHSLEGRDPEVWGVLGGHPGEDCETVRAWPPIEAALGTAPGTPR